MSSANKSLSSQLSTSTWFAQDILPCRKCEMTSVASKLSRAFAILSQVGHQRFLLRTNLSESTLSSSMRRKSPCNSVVPEISLANSCPLLTISFSKSICCLHSVACRVPCGQCTWVVHGPSTRLAVSNFTASLNLFVTFV